MDPKLLEQWLAKKDAEYAAAGFSEDKRRAWADWNRKRYSDYLAQQQAAQAQQPQLQLQHETPHPYEQLARRLTLPSPAPTQESTLLRLFGM